MNKRSPNWIRTAAILLLDLIAMAACGGLALFARFDFSMSAIPHEFAAVLLRFLLIQSVVTLAVFLWRRMYHYVWRAVTAYDVGGMITAAGMAFVLSYVAARLCGVRIPTSVAFIDAFILTAVQVGMRCALRFYTVFLHKVSRAAGDERIMLIGAGEAGRMLLQELQNSDRTAGKVCCIVDDNPAKWGKHMNGVPISGGREEIGALAKEHRITQIIFAIPAAKAGERKAILELCQQTGCKVRTLPGLYQLVNGEVSLAAVKDVQVEDLLGREPVKLDTVVIDRLLRGQTVLVTGGGGSIGSELCRQIAGYGPKQLVILDNYENNAYEIQQELRRSHPELELRVEIASVREKERVYAVFDQYRPGVVFHAAAHKHVPLMESNPEEAVKNNIFGTWHVVRAAEKYGVRKCVMISTDKAVNPTNVMGASKRFCEMILQSRTGSKVEFCAVRFGNVLGSNGSVVPLFKRQIEEGGPVTLTDRRIIRYFMTIPEAAQLVLEAGAMAKRGQIFVLDMGEPVRIADLAENLIRLSGLEPHKDIEIKEVGLRPGEKLYEELLTDNENLIRTANEKIFVEQQEHMEQERIMDGLVRLDRAVTEENSREELVGLLKELVPTYRDAAEVNTRAVRGAAAR